MWSYLDWIELVTDSARWINSVTKADNNEKDNTGSILFDPSDS